MTDFTTKTFRETYRDFYDANDGYYRVLYNSGRALQARELIEQQTIIQEEIARFGRNIFKEGALVNPGGATVDNKLEYIRLTTASVFDSTLVGQVLTNGTIEFKILEMYDATTGGDPATLYVQYTDTSAVTNTTVAPRVAAGDVLSHTDGVTAVTMTVAADTAGVAGAGSATKAYYSAGDFFVQGHFVYMEGGSAFIDKYSGTPTEDIGFLIEENIITEGDDSSLYDNQGEVPDHTAPGAHRYQIKLTPTTRDQVDVEENFVFVARVVNGVVTREVGTFDAYNQINNLLAQRTKEESGDYVVEGFKAIFEEKDATNLNLDVTEGIAYVDGYRLEIGTTDITVPKAQTTELKEYEAVPALYGNWVYIDGSTTKGFGRLDAFGYVQLRNGTNVIGYANVRGVELDSIGYRVYLFNIFMETGESFSDVDSMKDPFPGYTDAVMPLLAGREGTLYGAANNNLLFALPQKSPEKTSITVANYTIQKYHDVTSTDGTLTFTGVEPSGWVISEKEGPILNIQPTNTGGNTWVYSGLTVGGAYTVATFEEATATPRTKTIATHTATQSLPTIDWEARPVELDKVDGLSIVKVEHRASSSDPWVDITYQFTLDGGQRDNYYDIAKAYIKSGYVMPTGATAEVRVEFTYYEHGSSGKYFAASSYVDDDYADIPSHTYATGEKISLRDVLDFRPVRNPTYLNEFTITELPQNASAITIPSIYYYLPRVDVLVANSVDSRRNVGFGELQVISGVPSRQARQPEIPTGSLALYVFQLNPYTFDRSDLTSTYIPNKRFTMKDIAKLEQRVDDIFELTTLSLLESNTNALTVLDANGNTRTKAGFIADNFSSFDFSDVSSVDYRASIDPDGQLKPSFRENSVRLKYDATNVDNTIDNHGDLVTLPYLHQSLVSQLLATGTMNVNPFAVITQQGHLTLSPASDEWVETRRLPDIMQTTVRRSTTVVGTVLTGRGDRVFERETTRTIQEFVGEQVVDVEIIPFMRSRKINFKVEGLRPNTHMFAFFGNQDVSSWVRQEPSFTKFSEDPTEYGSEYANATQHPFGGPTDLITDAEGQLSGSFFLPNTPTLSFRTGRQEFKLLDVSLNNDEDAIASSRTGYTSVGTIESIQRTIRTTRIIETVIGREDPLAQTFFIDRTENPNGLFLTKVRVFVESKDSVIPLQVQIRPVENGIPTSRVVPGSTKFVSPANITVTPFTDTTDIEDVKLAPTEIEFDEPVYLTSGEEYAIVLLAESVEYNVYTAQTYESIIGPLNRDKRVTRQPTLGSLFLSQNGFTWTPDQTRDLMFELDRAEFNSTGTLYLQNAALPNVTLNADPLETTSGSSLVKVHHEGHGFSANDTVTISSVANSIGGLPNTDFEGSFTVTSPTWEGYTIDVTNTATGSSVGGGDDVTASQQVMFDEYIPQIQTITPNSTMISSVVSRTVAASYGSSRGSNSVAYSLETTPVTTFLNDQNINTVPCVVATSDNAAKSIEFALSLSTDDTKVSPVVDLQRVSMLALENVIDDGEAAQHITTPTVIDESSVGLKVIFAANRPTGASFEVYVKTAVDEDGIINSPWVQVAIDNDLPTDDNPSIFRDYEYTGELTPFTVFQVKVVMRATNSATSPVIRDLRSIALVV